MINNDEEYTAVMLKLANINPVCVDTPEEDIVNELIEEIKEYENTHFKFNHKEDEITFEGVYNG